MNKKAKFSAAAACVLLPAVITVLGVNIAGLDAGNVQRAVEAKQKTENRRKVEYNGEEHKIGSCVETYLLVGTDNDDNRSSDIYVVSRNLLLK